MKELTVKLPDDDATNRLGRTLAGLVKPGDVIALEGDLGAGKSTLSRATIRELASDPVLDVPSPTFTLVLTYDTPAMHVWHYDLYRLEHADEMLELGFEETDIGLALIEWPGRMGDALPAWRLDVRLEIASQGRIAHLCPQGPDWSDRIDAFEF